MVLGIQPTRAETGYGYIETGSLASGDALRVRRFTEKPNAEKAAEFLKSGNYYWNSGMFLWSARTLADALTEHLPKTAAVLEKIAADYGTRKFAGTFRGFIRSARTSASTMRCSSRAPRKARSSRTSFACPRILDGTIWARGRRCTNIMLRKQSPADGNLISGQGIFSLNASRNYIHAPGKFVAVVGVNNMVVVETEDALLITTRENSQDVGKVVKHLDEKKLRKLV